MEQKTRFVIEVYFHTKYDLYSLYKDKVDRINWSSIRQPSQGGRGDERLPITKVLLVLEVEIAQVGQLIKTILWKNMFREKTFQLFDTFHRNACCCWTRNGSIKTFFPNLLFAIVAI